MNQTLMFHTEDPELIAKIETKLKTACKPRCTRCGKIQPKRELATRVCADRDACTVRAICSFRAPKGMALKTYGRRA